MRDLYTVNIGLTNLDVGFIENVVTVNIVKQRRVMNKFGAALAKKFGQTTMTEPMGKRHPDAGPVERLAFRGKFNPQDTPIDHGNRVSDKA